MQASLLRELVLYRITQCYLPPGRGDIPAFTPAEAGTQLRLVIDRFDIEGDTVDVSIIATFVHLPRFGYSILSVLLTYTVV